MENAIANLRGSHLWLFTPDAEAYGMRRRFRTARTSLGPLLAYDSRSQVRSFAAAFFLRNMLKCTAALRAFSRFGFGETNRLVDYGCGAGASTIAWGEVFGWEGRSALMVDQSPYQLEIAADLSASVRARASFRQQRIECAPGDHDGDILFSYFLCEQPARLGGYRTVQHVLRHKCRTGGDVVFIDYPEVIESIQRRAPACRLRRRLKRRVLVPESLQGAIGQKSVSVNAILLRY